MEDWSTVADGELVRSLKALVQDERRNLVRILGRLAEMDRRRLAQKRGFPSLFAFCLRELRYSESETARRIHAARAAASFPLLYPMLASGRLSLTAVSMLAPRLTPGNHRDLIRRALGRSQRELDALLASFRPRHEPADRVRHIQPLPPSPASPMAPAAAEGSGSESACVQGGGLAEPGSPPPAGADVPSDWELFSAPMGPASAGTGGDIPASSRSEPARIEFLFVADAGLLRDIDRAKDLLRHKYPKGRLEEVLGDALHALLERIDPDRRLKRKALRRAAAGKAPRAGPVGGGAASAGARPSRRIPRWVRDEVWIRDGGRCAFQGPEGRRCGARGGLEFDHLRPVARGGRGDDPASVRLLCRAHNALEARRILGDAVVDAALRRRGRARSAQAELPTPGSLRPAAT